MKHSVPAQFQRENSEVGREGPDFGEDGAFFTLIEELLGQEIQAVPPPGFAQARNEASTLVITLSVTADLTTGRLLMQ